jgi:hypothetical protein
MANVKTGMFSSKKFPLLFDSDEVKLLALSVFRAFGMEAYLTEFKIDLSLLSNLGIDLSHFATATEPLNVPTYTMLEGNLHLGLTVKTPDDEGVLTFVPNMGHPPINGFTLLADHEVNCILHALRAKRQILLMQFSGDETRFEKALEDVNTSLEDYHTNPTAFAVLAHIFDFAISAVVRQGFPNVLLSDMSNQLGFRDSLIAKTRTRPEDLESVLNLVGAIGMGNLVTGNHQLTRLEAAYLISIGSFYGTVG